MNIFYNGVDITQSVQPISIQILDKAGGQPDSLDIIFSDQEGLWSQWKPAKNDTLQVKQSGFDTGIMYIDELGQNAGVFGIKALSIPQTCKTERSKGWENVRFMELVNQIAARYGFKVKTYNISNHLYMRINQNNEADLSFLAYRCLIEGYSLKINNNTLVIYDEAKEEQKLAQSTIYQSNMNGNFEFRNKSTDIYERCIVHGQGPSELIEGEYVDTTIFGATLNQKIYVSNQDEANRWSRGILRSFNKYMVTGKFNTNLNLNLAAGSCVNIQDTGMFDGKFFTERIVHDLINNRSRFTVRKTLDKY